MFQADLKGSTLSNVFDMAVDFFGDTRGTDNGIRSLTGTINSSNQVTLNFNVGGSFTVTINGTLNSSGLPSFSGTGTVSGPACASNGQAVPTTGVLAGSLAGSYSGASASDSTAIITMNLAEDGRSRSQKSACGKLTQNHPALGKHRLRRFHAGLGQAHQELQPG